MNNSLVKTIETVSNFLSNKKSDNSLSAIYNRITILNKIKEWILNNYDDIINALKKDLNKSEIETLISEVSIVLKQIKYYTKNLTKFYKEKKVKSGGMLGMQSTGFYTYKPLGTVFLINPYNYPFHLSMLPFVTCIASGNFAIIKNSPKAINTSRLFLKMVQEINLNDIVCFLDENVSKDFIFEVISLKPDLLFFTGSNNFGKELKKQAILNEVKTVLELGSSNPVIVDESADIELAAKRIVWAKLMNMGQTCVAPNSIFCDEKIYDKLVDAINAQLSIQYNTHKYSYVRMIDLQHLNNVVNNVRNLTGVELECDTSNLTIKPTLLKVQNSNSILFEEIFAPILFITSFQNLTDFCSNFKSKIDNSLSIYVFSNNDYNIKNISDTFNYGSICINELLLQVSNINLPFGGIKSSGVGKYHGNFGLIEFSNLVSILKGSKSDSKLRYFNKIGKYKNLVRFLCKR